MSSAVQANIPCCKKTMVKLSTFVFNNKTIPGHALYEKGLQKKTKRRRSTGRQPGTKSASRPGDKPLTNRLKTACQPLVWFPHSVYIGFCLFVLLERRSGDVSSMPWGVRGALVSWANCCVGAVLPGPAPPPRRAPRPDPPEVCTGFGLDKCFAYQCIKFWTCNIGTPTVNTGRTL